MASQNASYDHLIKLLLIGDSGKLKLKYMLTIYLLYLSYFYRCWKELCIIKILR